MEIESYTNFLLEKAQEIGTSDIHVLPNKGKYTIYFRIAGQLESKYTLPTENGVRFIQYLKYLANMDVGERRAPQGGGLVYQLADESEQDLRISVITNYHGQESMVIRLLESQERIMLEESTFLIDELKQIKILNRYKSGLILFSGPVNSGKTTTMYQLIRERIDQAALQVITIEDPVEIEEERFFQIQVNEQAGGSYEESLKASLRHHPDLIVVGEIRDEETARMAIRAALTGHLILATVHARNAEGVITRMLELDVSLELLKQTLIGVVFQKLLPVYCEFCEGSCQSYCCFNNPGRKRAALYDLLDSAKIQKLEQENLYESSLKRERNFNHLLKKVYAYGYISEDTHNQYFIP